MKRRTVNKKTLETWLKEVDNLVHRFAGVSVHELADAPYACWHEDGMKPRNARRRSPCNRQGGNT